MTTGNLAAARSPSGPLLGAGVQNGPVVEDEGALTLSPWPDLGALRGPQTEARLRGGGVGSAGGTGGGARAAVVRLWPSPRRRCSEPEAPRLGRAHWLPTQQRSVSHGPGQEGLAPSPPGPAGQGWLSWAWSG